MNTKTSLSSLNITPAQGAKKKTQQMNKSAGLQSTYLQQFKWYPLPLIPLPQKTVSQLCRSPWPLPPKYNPVPLLEEQVHQGEEEEVPQAEAHLVEVEVHPVEAEAHPVEAEVHPVEAEVHPVEAEAHPVEAEAHLVEAEAHPVEAEAHLVEVEAHPVEVEVHPVEAEAHPVVMGSPECSGQCLEGLERSGHSLGCPGCLGHSLERF